MSGRPVGAYTAWLIIIFRYSTVIRSANAYVPPGARRSGNGAVTPTSANQPKADAPKVAVNGPDGTPVKEAQKPASPAPAGAAASNVVCGDLLVEYRV